MPSRRKSIPPETPGSTWPPLPTVTRAERKPQVILLRAAGQTAAVRVAEEGEIRRRRYRWACRAALADLTFRADSKLYTRRTGPGYLARSASLVRRVIPSARAWASSRRSKGSLCRGGRASMLTACWLVIGSSM